MRVTKKGTQMVAAAKFIKKRCKGDSGNCEGCPFDAVGQCCPLYIPETWEIPKVSENEKC